MSSETSTNPVRLKADTAADPGLQPWQFFVLAALGCATAVTFIARGRGPAAIILLSVLMAAGLAGAAVIATDAVISITVGFSRIVVFGVAGAVTAQTLAFAALIGCVAFPGAFLARAFVERMPMHVHTAILDAVVLFGGAVMVFSALLK